MSLFDRAREKLGGSRPTNKLLIKLELYYQIPLEVEKDLWIWEEGYGDMN
ncbi:hypothetical protein HY025_03535 [Candidatus Daviesbacteria bacterium]|nr:hypothetical protein [Candidatus Daviesbacteria bacterium]